MPLQSLQVLAIHKRVQSSLTVKTPLQADSLVTQPLIEPDRSNVACKHMQLHPPHTRNRCARFHLSHQPPGQAFLPALSRHIQRHHIRPPPGYNPLNMDDDKPDNLAATLLRNANHSVLLLGELPHRLTIETKLLRKASLIQLKHRL